jgi:hypothetical protein
MSDGPRIDWLVVAAVSVAVVCLGIVARGLFR